MQKLYKQLRDDITFGKFKPGEHLSEKLLTEHYAVSRSSIREVTGQLARQGYLTFKPNRGVIVTKLSLEDIDVTYNILVRCESYATRFFARSHDASIRRKLDALHRKMQKESIRHKYKSWIALNDDFHEMIYSNCGESILSDLIQNMRLRIYRYRHVDTGPEIINAYNQQHQEILQAIAEGNERIAEKLMFGHLETALKNRLEVLKELNGIL